MHLYILISGSKNSSIGRREIADLLDSATRAITKKVTPVFTQPTKPNYNMDDDPYEFIDEISDEGSPGSYKEFTIKHSPLKVKKRLSLLRTAKVKKVKNPALRKSARISVQCSEDIYETIEEFV